jgi:uncharacterized RDD family membrane protein YckC/tRNA A-37 threonylcarbamoyl transferase component Bud32
MGVSEARPSVEPNAQSSEGGDTAKSREAVSLAATAYDTDRPPVPPGATTSDDLIGKRIDHFEIRAQLGQGGMGTVYLAHDLSLERPVAIKVLRRELIDNPDLVERLVLEARAQARLSHPNVVNVFHIGQFEGAPYFAMEYVRGETLADRLQKSGPLRWEVALEYIIQTTRALLEANQRGIVHRDVKPSNLIVSAARSQAEARAHVKVADFGLALPTGISEVHFVGSPYYASPEQIAGKPPDHRSDIYSLGVTFHELLTGAPPFEADSLRAITKMHQGAPRPAIPARQAPWRLRQLVVEMMDPDPAKRPWTYEELLKKLEALRPRELIPGGLVARAMAATVDVTLFALLAQIAIGVFGLTVTHAFELAFGAFALYYVLAHRFGSQTLGKRLFRMRIQGTTRPVSTLGLVLRFAVEFWGPIAALLLWQMEPEQSGPRGATEIRAVKERINEFLGWEEVPLLDKGAEELLALVTGANLVVALPWIAGLLLALFDDNRRALHDLFARTRVVYAMRESTHHSGP